MAIKYVGIALTAIGTALLGINLVGSIMPPLTVPEEKFQEHALQYHERSLTPYKAMIEFKALKEDTLPLPNKADKLFLLIKNSFIHLPDAQYKIQPWDNWIMWLRGLVNKRFHVSQDTDLIWRRGGGFCDQAASLYAGKAQELGLESRILWLSGHVVAEVRIPEKGWQVIDPDMGVLWGEGIETLDSNKVVSRMKQEGFSDALAQKMAAIYTSQADNRRTYYPYLPQQYEFEKQAMWLKWFIPCLLVLLGFTAIRRRAL